MEQDRINELKEEFFEENWPAYYEECIKECIGDWKQSFWEDHEQEWQEYLEDALREEEADINA